MSELTISPEDQENYLEIIEVVDCIKHSGFRIRDMITNHLEDTLMIEPINLKDMLSRMVDSFQSCYSDGLRVFELHYSIEEEDFCFDRIKLSRAIQNVLTNSTKFTNEGIILIHVEKDYNELIISVKDSGCGIPKDILDRIFDYRFQGQPRKDSYGLGLWIAKELIEIQNGQIDIFSKENIGTIVKIKLPLYPR